MNFGVVRPDFETTCEFRDGPLVIAIVERRLGQTLVVPCPELPAEQVASRDQERKQDGGNEPAPPRPRLRALPNGRGLGGFALQRLSPQLRSNRPRRRP